MEKNKNILILAGQEFEVVCNFRKQHDLTKFRNKLAYGVDFSETDKSTLEKVLKMKEDIVNGKEITMEDLPEDVINFINKTANKAEIFSADELIEIGMILTGIKSEEIVEEMYDEDIQEGSYDDLVQKLIHSMSLVFMNAKSGLEEKETQIVPMKSNEVAK